MIWCSPLFAQAQNLTLHRDAHCFVWLNLAQCFWIKIIKVTSAFTESLFQADKNLTTPLIAVIEEEPNSSTKL